ncbi:S41 family peptidase [Luteithermobacter gelatinilyticus]|uniref:S41 family peptidase n=1 Tax=Luteithermobacter gelatinilyticus TaxID=2582913 RepID=UPI001105FFD5|nr:S41 family peptidase [Luteithermobacter gelatinilyticus]
MTMFMRFCAVILVCAIPGLTWGAIDARMMRYPDVSRDKILFTYDSDLWLVSIKGGRAVRLTADGGEEKRGKFSPDGTEIAYSATYNNNRDLYIIPQEGGIPRRITHHPAPDKLLDWTEDGTALLFASTMYSERPRYNKLFLVSRDGGLPEQLPVAYGESVSLSADKTQLIYTAKKDFQEESWKKYQGGRAPNLWFLDTTTGESKRLTHFPGSQSQPMRRGSLVYYLSEQGSERRSNIWVLDLNNQQEKQLTHFTEYDVRHPSLGPKHIIFQNGGHLYLFELKTGNLIQIQVDLVITQKQLAVQQISVEKNIVHISADQQARNIYFEARGEIFRMTQPEGVTVNLTRSPGIAERYPVPSPDHKKLAYFSDETGEYQLYIRDLNSHKTQALTRFSKGYRYKPQWSPDGRHIVFIDNEQVLHIVDTHNGQHRIIDKGEWRGHHELQEVVVSWSPDSRWLAFSRHLVNLNQAIFLYDTQNNKLTQVTSGTYNDFNPIFGPDGNYLYMLSHRQFSPVFGDIDPTWTYAHSTVISVIPLTRDIPTPTTIYWITPQPRKKVSIDLDGMERRLVTLMPGPGIYDNLSVVSDKIVYREIAPNLPGETKKPNLKYLNLENPLQGIQIAENTEQVFILPYADVIVLRQNGRYSLVKATANAEPTALDTSGLLMRVNRSAEHAQMLKEALRYMRDFFYDPGLHGLELNAVAKKYKKLLQFVTSEEDMTVLLRELAGELSGGHIWATAKDPRRNRKNTSVGLLGIDFQWQNNRYQITKIYPGETYVGAPRSPLADPSLAIAAGDYLLAINDLVLDSKSTPWAALEGHVEKVVKLTISSTPDFRNSREVYVRTLVSEQKLRELEWVAENRRKVTEASQGRLGYIYVPDTSLNGQNDLMRQFRAQHHLPGLIIDERFNMGGALGDRLVELLNRPALNYFSYRNARDYPLPTIGHTGPKALLINGWSYSGGDGFPYLFRAAGIGPLIGGRTWGGLIGPNLPLPFINGGAISVPPQRVYSIDGHWADNNNGVPADIQIINDPAKLYRGRDMQLNKAVQVLLEELKVLPVRKTPPFHGDIAGNRN